MFLIHLSILHSSQKVLKQKKVEEEKGIAERKEKREEKWWATRVRPRDRVTENDQERPRVPNYPTDRVGRKEAGTKQTQIH